MSSSAHWDRIYTGKEPSEVSWYQATPHLSLQLIERCHLPRNAHLIDVGGGASTLVDALLHRGYTQVSVLDISSQALEHAKARLGPLAQKVEWLVADIATFVAHTDFAVWHDRAVFHFLTDERDRQLYVDTLKGAVPAGGYVIIAAFSIGGPNRCSGLDVVQYDAETLQAELGSAFELLETADEIHVTPSHKPQPFSYFRFVRVST